MRGIEREYYEVGVVEHDEHQQGEHLSALTGLFRCVPSWFTFLERRLTKLARAVHSSFIYPRAGPTPQQVAFISSRESLGAYGYGAGVGSDYASPPTFLAATSSTSLALPTSGNDSNTLTRPQNRMR
jgi:hypothetical protein